MAMVNNCAISTHVDDVVDAFLRAGASDEVNGQVFNLGGPAPISLLELTQLLVQIAGQAVCVSCLVARAQTY